MRDALAEEQLEHDKNMWFAAYQLAKLPSRSEWRQRLIQIEREHGRAYRKAVAARATFIWEESEAVNQ